MPDIVQLIARFTARLGGLIVLLMAFLIGIDVVGRKLFGFTVLSGGSAELAGYSLAIVTSWGASLTLLYRAHIRIDVIHSIMPKRLWVWFDLLAIIAFMLASLLLAWLGTGTYLESVQRHTHSMTPLAVPLSIPQGIWAAGLVFLLLTSVYLVFKSIYFIFIGKAKKAEVLIGSRSAQEDLEEQQDVIKEMGGDKHA